MIPAINLTNLCKGTSDWTVSGDYQCSANTTLKVQANLNSCMENFNCDSGDCIPMAQRCNGVNDCEDSSDEFNCKVGNLLLNGLSHEIDLAFDDMYVHMLWR